MSEWSPRLDDSHRHKSTAGGWRNSFRHWTRFYTRRNCRLWRFSPSRLAQSGKRTRIGAARRQRIRYAGRRCCRFSFQRLNPDNLTSFNVLKNKDAQVSSVRYEKRNRCHYGRKLLQRRFVLQRQTQLKTKFGFYTRKAARFINLRCLSVFKIAFRF